MEQKKAERFERGELIRILLAVAAGGLVIGTLALMPGLALALQPFVSGRNVSRQSLRKTYNLLVQKRFVKLKEEKGRYILQITEDGKRAQEEFQFQDSLKELKISPPKKWDKRWRLLVFDVPEEEREARDALRDFLKDLGFYRFQDSVFIHPFPCEHEVELLKELFEIQKYVYCFTVEEHKVPSAAAYHFSPLLSEYI